MSRESIRSFAGGCLTFLKLGSTSAGFGGCVWNFFLKVRIAKSLLLQCVREFWPVAWRSVHTMINRYVDFWPVLCVCCWWGQNVCGPLWGLGEDSNFQLVRGPQNWVLGHLQAEEAFYPIFCWKLCRLWSYPFIRTHGLEIAIPRDSYLKPSTCSKHVEVYSQSLVTTIVFVGLQTFHLARAPRKWAKATLIQLGTCTGTCSYWVSESSLWVKLNRAWNKLVKWLSE